MRRTLLALVAALILLGAGAQGASSYSNGYLPESALAPIATGVKCPRPLNQLANQSAAAFNSMALATGQKLATNGCDSAYRPYERQVYMKEYWCGQGNCSNAATPGLSNHGLGKCTDNPPPTLEVIVHIGERFGFAKRWSDASWEPWHICHNDAIFHRPNPGTDLHSPTLRQHSGGPGQNIPVRKLQKLLRGHGDKSVDVDGSFGFETRIAVERFQHAEYLKVNGVVSKRVWKRLRRPATKPIKTTPKVVPATIAPAPPPAHGKPKKPRHHERHPKGPAWGIDVSSNNGSIDWGKVRHSGASFACVKATEGQDYIDTGFGRKKMRAVTEAKLVPCVYHFLRPRGDRAGAREAAWFTQVIGHAGYGKGWLPPVLDVETTELGPAETCRYVGSFLRLVRRNLGVKAIVYTYPSFAQANFSGCSWLGKYRLWIAHYGVSSPTIPNPPWSTRLMWQYTSTAHVAGVGGDVDVNKLTGGRAELVKLRVGELPKRARRAPRAKVELPLALDSSVQSSPTTAETQRRLGLSPAPEGEAIEP